MVRDRELEEMSGNSLVPENWPRIFDRRPDVEVLRVRVVCRDEIESGRILVINARRIHEAARAGWLEGFGQLPDLKFPEVIRQRDQPAIFQEADHLRLAAFISLQEGRLVRRNVFAPLRVGIGQRRVRQPRFVGAILRQLHPPDHFHLRRIERQEQDVMEIVVVIFLAHRARRRPSTAALFPGDPQRRAARASAPSRALTSSSFSSGERSVARVMRLSLKSGSIARADAIASSAKSLTGFCRFFSPWASSAGIARSRVVAARARDFWACRTPSSGAKKSRCCIRRRRSGDRGWWNARRDRRRPRSRAASGRGSNRSAHLWANSPSASRSLDRAARGHAARVPRFSPVNNPSGDHPRYAARRRCSAPGIVHYASRSNRPPACAARQPPPVLARSRPVSRGVLCLKYPAWSVQESAHSQPARPRPSKLSQQQAYFSQRGP